MDKSGNVNLTWVNQTTKTLATPNSPPTMPTNPAPSNHTPNQSINTDLNWSCGDPDAGDTLTYDVYFGTSTTPALVSNDQAGTTYDPGTLNYSTTYYWKVIATDNHGASTSGPLWDFTTSPVPASTGTVSGTITHTNNGTGIPRVAVKLSQDSTVLASTPTDSNGNFLLGGVSRRVYPDRFQDHFLVEFDLGNRQCG